MEINVRNLNLSQFVIENKSKIFCANAASSHKQSLSEVMLDKVVQEKLADTKAARDVLSMQKFIDLMQTDPHRATYGWKTVNKANEQKGIDTLMISDELIRAQDIATRKKYVELVQKVHDNGGQVNIFSSSHTSGAQLSKHSGLAAILRFPMAHLEDEEEEEHTDTPTPGSGGSTTASTTSATSSTSPTTSVSAATSTPSSSTTKPASSGATPQSAQKPSQKSQQKPKPKPQNDAYYDDEYDEDYDKYAEYDEYY